MSLNDLFTTNSGAASGNNLKAVFTDPTNPAPYMVAFVIGFFVILSIDEIKRINNKYR